MTISLTDSAAARIKILCAENNASMLRLSVDGGGCSGFQYVFGFANDIEAGDSVFKHNDASLVVDDVSVPLIAGATLDFVDEIAGAHFKVINPNAQSSCGCGTSFSVKQ